MPKHWSHAFAALALPLASAQVVVNEIMYNPAGSDSGREWVELYNPGAEDVQVTGGSGSGSWRIGDSSNHTLTDPAGGIGRGSLTIPAGGYLVVSNDPTTFISGEYAGGDYSVVKSSISLSNSGSTISLTDGTGALLDSVSYTSAEGGSDDGASLQRQADGTWIAALPTPGAVNSATPYIDPPPSTDASSGAKTSATTTANPNPSYVPPPTPDLFADAGDDKSAIAGADVEFDASAYDKSQAFLDPGTVRFSWNFGDGGSAEGGSVLHHFSYPGRYAVIVNIAHLKNAASDEIDVTVEPAALSFSLLSDGGIQIGNDSGHDLDLSGWIVRESGDAFASQFMLPEHSKILSGAAMNISPQTLVFRASSSTVLEYPNGTFAFAIGASASPVASTTPAAKVSAAAAPQPATIAQNAKQPPPSANSTEEQTEVTPGESDESDEGEPFDFASTEPPSAESEEAAVSSAPSAGYLLPLGALALVLAAGTGSLAFVRSKRGEWDIIEDTSE